jgi:1-acyl-sn-glycerol-3-phosphate acyltransferase
VVFFPEGSRSDDGSLQPFKEGLSFFAEQLGLPVVPAWIGGTHALLPKGAGWPRPGRITVAVGPPLAPASPALAQTLRARMVALSSASP